MKRSWMEDLRRKKGLTLGELGAVIGLGESAMCLIEAGRRKQNGLTVRQIEKIAKATGVDATTLFRAEIYWLEVERDR